MRVENTVVKFESGDGKKIRIGAAKLWKLKDSIAGVSKPEFLELCDMKARLGESKLKKLRKLKHVKLWHVNALSYALPGTEYDFNSKKFTHTTRKGALKAWLGNRVQDSVKKKWDEKNYGERIQKALNDPDFEKQLQEVLGLLMVGIGVLKSGNAEDAALSANHSNEEANTSSSDSSQSSNSQSSSSQSSSSQSSSS